MLRLLGRPWAFRRVMGMAGGGASFVGAYDAVPSIVAAYGMRRLLTSYTGALVRLRRASDNAEMDFGYDANGDLDAAAIATWLTATTGYAVTWYDQSGGGRNATQSAAGSQPLYVASGQNSKPVLRFNGTSSYMATTQAALVNASILAAAKASSAPGITDRIIVGVSFSGGNRSYLGRNSFDRWGAGVAGVSYTTIAESAATNTSCQLLEIVYDGSNVNFLRNSSSRYAAAQSGAISSSGFTYNIGSLNIDGSSSYYFGGDIPETVIASAAWSLESRQAAEAAANTYWSIY